MRLVKRKSQGEIIFKKLLDNRKGDVYSTPHWSTLMTTEQIKALIKDKQIIDFQTDDQDFAHGLRLVLRDAASGKLGLLAIETCELTMPDEIVLDYSYQVLSEPDMPHFDECHYNFTPEPPAEGQQGLFG